MRKNTNFFIISRIIIGGSFVLFSIIPITLSCILSCIVYLLSTINNTPLLKTDREDVIKLINEFTNSEPSFKSIWLKNNRIHVLHYNCGLPNNEKKTPILFAHGTMSSSFSYIDFIKHSRDRDVYAIDLPGYGISEWFENLDPLDIKNRDIIFEQYRELFYHVLENIGKKKWILFGHSFGGFIIANSMLLRPVKKDGPIIEHYYLSGLPGLYNITNYTCFFGYILKYGLIELLVKSKLRKQMCLFPLYFFRNASTITKCNIANFYNTDAVNGSYFVSTYITRESLTLLYYNGALHVDLIKQVKNCDNIKVTLINGQEDKLIDSNNIIVTSILTERKMPCHIIPKIGHDLLTKENAQNIYDIINNV